ncbi:MAG TPA: precorrin-6A synthase (deacetylating) [Nocardioides sp.]|uniref:precorrin-6A synthase (deacetylating) n=1 Tax=Nocardioides sp. TaxID=35761 RepID=UPI002ED80DDB
MSPATQVRVLGIGMGPQHVTPEVADALRGCDYVLAAEKRDEDGLLAARRAIADAYGVELVAVPDAERDRSPDSTGAEAGYQRAVRDWHEARVNAYERVLRERGGTAAFLVWGDPSLYDSTIRIVERLAQRRGISYDVLPGISAPQLLAARHRVVLHPVGAPVHVTTARRLRDDLAAGQTNVCVMLTGTLDLDDLDDWSIWWGANLGTDSEELVAGRVGDVLGPIHAARDRAKAAAGWVMDVYLLRAPEVRA